MGHSRLGQLPRTKKWVALVQTVVTAAGVPRVAVAVLDAAERELSGAHKDAGLVEAVRLLLLLPVAARADDFAADLRGRGVDVDDAHGLMDVLGAVAAGWTPPPRATAAGPTSARWPRPPSASPSSRSSAAG